MTPSGQRGVGRRVDAREAPAVVVEDRRRAHAQTRDDAAVDDGPPGVVERLDELHERRDARR